MIKRILVFWGLYASLVPAYAVTFTQNGAPAQPWERAACSADGTKVAAVSGGSTGSIYISTNGGGNWTPTSPTNANWSLIAASADGTKLAAVIGAGSIFTSGDSGMTWTQATNAPAGNWTSITMSGDGSKLAATLFNSRIYTSSDSGTTWVAQAGSPIAKWWAITSSADGSKLAAAVFLSGIWTSTNSGTNWNQTTAVNASWQAIASSADGSVLAAAATLAAWAMGADLRIDHWGKHLESNDRHQRTMGCDFLFGGRDKTLWPGCRPAAFFTSTNTGGTWNPSNLSGFQTWIGTAAAADGNKLFALDFNGGIYTAQTTPHPALSETSSGSGLTLSWMVPSTNFAVQQISDLKTTNWTTLAISPMLKPTNYQQQLDAIAFQQRRFFPAQVAISSGVQ